MHASGLPSRPRLPPGTEIISVDRDKLLLRSFSRTVMLSGTFISPPLIELLRQLNGCTSIDVLIAELDQERQREFKEFVSALAAEKFIEDGGLDAPSEISSHERAYWSLSGLHESETRANLKKSTVLLINLGGVGSNAARALVRLGIGTLTVLDERSVTKADAVFGYQPSDVGRLRTDVLKAEMMGPTTTQIVPIASTIDGYVKFDELVSQADLVVVCGDNMSLAGYERTNAVCIQHQKPWLSARIDRTRGILGPFVVPEQTACFSCYELRSRANSEHPADHEAMYRHWRELDSCAESWPTIAPFGNILGNYLAIDIARVLGTKQLSSFLGRILHVELHGFEARFHELLKLPRCPACSRLRERPMTRIWDIPRSAGTENAAE